MRPGSSLLLFAMIFAPLALRSHDVFNSFKRAVPMLLIAMCTFIANDLDDMEADRINHPERPLPSNKVGPLGASVIYFVCLAAALLTTKIYVPLPIAFLYYLTMTLTISYRYVVAFIPAIKAPYAAGAIALPAVIDAGYDGSARLYLVALAVFVFALGRELCMDVIDRPGDKKSMLYRFSANTIATCAFMLQAASLFLISRSLSTLSLLALVDLIAIVTLLLLGGICWFVLGRYTITTDLMKLQLLLGLYYLI